MGATDNAFIRVFDGSHAPSNRVRKRSQVSGVTVDRESITVATEPALVSEVYAGVAEKRPIVVKRHQPAETPSAPDDSPPPAIPVSLPKSFRLDIGGVKTMGPHLRPSVLEQASAAILSPDESEITASVVERPTKLTILTADKEELPEHGKTTVSSQSVAPLPDRISQPWHPEWEVDSFRWPKICDQLTRDSASSLSEVVRPVLSSAWRGKNVLAVTSFGRKEGCSTIALSVARMAASFHVPVALVDGDLESPSIGSSLGMAYEHGWNNIDLPMSLKEIAIGSLKDRMVVLPVNEHAGDVEPCMAKNMLKELSSHFELVVIDAGPIFTSAYRWFAEPLSSQIHGTLIVRDVRETSSHQIEDVYSRLENVGIADISIVENFQENE